jgi:hypothetical protein
MTANEAIGKIADLLGMKFKSEKFFQTKLVDGVTTITNNQEGPFSISEPLFVVAEDGIMTPAPAGRHETREGLILEVLEDGTISKIEEATPEEDRVREASNEIIVDTEVMTSATLTDGTKIETDDKGDFQVGQKLYVITEAGEKVSAPEGEHTTDSGITITVDRDGFITGVKYPGVEGEGSLEDYKKQMETMMSAMKDVVSAMSQFSNELESLKKDYEEFKRQPVNGESILKRNEFKKVTRNVLDEKIDFLKNNNIIK